jgi:CHASE3 domain sensor protein
MQPFYKRFSVITGFSALLILLLINGLIIRRQVAVQVENQEWVQHTQDVLLQISQTESLLKDAETGQRGYLYTGEPRYLAPYDLAINQIKPDIDQLAAMTSDNPVQQDRIAKLRTLANQKLQELSETIVQYKSGRLDDARTLVLTDSGLLTMDKIRALVSELQNEETSLSAARSAIYQKSVRITVFCIYAASILAGLGLILLA